MDSRFQLLLLSSVSDGFVYSLSKASSFSCGGHQLFKFNANSMSPNPTWALSTTDPTCLVMGIEFGRGESTLYALGFQDGIDLFFMDAANGNLLWS